MHVLFWSECHSPIMRISATFRSEHSWNVQIWYYMNSRLRYFLYHKTELLLSASNAQTTSNVQTTFRIQIVHLAFSFEHSMNILTWTFIQFSFWTMRGSFFNVRRNIPGMFYKCYRAHWVDLLNYHCPTLENQRRKCKATVPHGKPERNEYGIGARSVVRHRHLT